MFSFLSLFLKSLLFFGSKAPAQGKTVYVLSLILQCSHFALWEWVFPGIGILCENTYHNRRITNNHRLWSTIRAHLQSWGDQALSCKIGQKVKVSHQWWPGAASTQPCTCTWLVFSTYTSGVSVSCCSIVVTSFIFVGYWCEFEFGFCLFASYSL